MLIKIKVRYKLVLSVNIGNFVKLLIENYHASDRITQ